MDLDKKLGFVLAFGTAAVTIFLLTGSVSDPVNAPKLFILGGAAVSAISLVIVGFLRKQIGFSKVDLVAIFFVVWSLISAAKSSSPISQNLYGVYGRNTGLITYLLFTFIFLAASKIRFKANFKPVLLAFITTSGINVLYGTWVLVFGDFISWQNQYGALLGTFGNPNFISSFYGMAFSVSLLAVFFQTGKNRMVGLILCPLILYLILRTDSLQGLVLASVGIYVNFFFLIRRHKKRIAQIFYLGVGAILSISSIFGVFGFGPLQTVLRQNTILFREQYWFAAINMAKLNPMFGVGMDSYGDWYRRARGIKSLTTPGVDTVTNAAHNVYLDLLSYGGIPLLLFYLTLIIFSFKSALNVLKRDKKIDPIFIAIFLIWTCYHIQALISINQIGLAIWGWLTSGLLIAYDRCMLDDDNKLKSPKNSTRRKSESIISLNLVAGLGLIVGFLISVPPLSADMKWRDVQAGGGTALLDGALSGSYMAPRNSFRLAQAVEVLEKSNLPDLAIKYARIGVQFNPQSYNAWQMLYYATNSTMSEKNRAKSQMMRLDPLNPNIQELK
jgi:O-antigen ligase